MALWIILGIVGFLFVLTLFPLKFHLQYGQELRINCRYLFLNFQILPAKPKKKAPPKKKRAPGPKKPPPKKEPSLTEKLKLIIKQQGAAGFLSLVKELSRLFGTALKRLLRHTNIKMLDICFTAGGENAGDTALQYGEACGIIYPAVSMLGSISPIAKLGLTIDADYKAESSRVLAELKLSIALIFAIREALSLLVHGFFLLLRLRMASQEPSQAK